MHTQTGQHRMNEIDTRARGGGGGGGGGDVPYTQERVEHPLPPSLFTGTMLQASSALDLQAAVLVNRAHSYMCNMCIDYSRGWAFAQHSLTDPFITTCTLCTPCNQQTALRRMCTHCIFE